LAANVAGARRSNSIIAAVGGFLAVLVIPAALIAAYYILDRRRRRQHELEVSLQAERAAHESREAFLTAVSHQLREPLWAVRGISRMLGNDDILMAQPRMADLHVLLAGELDDMNGLMDNLLTASRLEADALEYTMEAIEVREATRALTDSLDHRGASIYVAMDDGVVTADRRHLRQILWNLISNALKYGGPNIEIKGLAETDSYTIVVIDDGSGVPRAVEEQLFTRFVHSDKESHNVGLGLSIVMALAVGMGGTAFYKREDGLTRFGVVLPDSLAPAIPSALYEPPTMTPVTRAAG
jgi:K+-sensing histidine kinase KdpD